MTRETNPDHGPRVAGRSLVAIVCALLLVPGESALLAQATPAPAASPAAAEADDPPLTADQLDSLVAPIALYPDDAPRAGARRLHVPARARPTPAVDGEELEAQGQSPRRRRRKTAVGPERPVDGRRPGGPQAPRGRCSVDDGPRKRIPRAAEGSHGGLPADAEEGAGQGRPQDERAAEGRDEGRRAEAGDRRRVREPRGHLRTLVQPDVRLSAAGLSLPARLLPAVHGGRRVRVVRRRDDDGRGHLGRLVLRMRLGRRQRERQRQQQLQPEHERQRREPRPGRRQLEPQRLAPRRHAVRQQGDSEQVRRYVARPAGRPGRIASASNRAAGGAGGGGGAGGAGPERGTATGPPAAEAAAVGGAAASDRSAGGGSRGGDSIGSRDVGGGGGSRGGSSGFGGGSGGYSGSSARSSSSRGSSSMGSRGGGGGGRGGGGGGRGGGGRR